MTTIDAAGILGLIGIIAPVFLIVLLGYGLGRSGFLDPGQVRAMGRFALYVAMPALVFNALSGATIGRILRLDYLAVYSLASLGAFAAGFAWFRWRGDSGQASGTAFAAVRALGVSGSNTSFVGLPVLGQLFGPAATGPIALNMLFENFVLLPLVIALIELGQGEHSHPRAAFAGVARNLLRAPLIWAILLGTLCAVLGLALPAPLARGAGMVASASAPLALITIGASLAWISLGGRRPAIATLVAGKLLLHPALVLAALLVIPIADPLFHKAAILLACMPMFSIFPVFAQRTGDAETCSAAMLVGTCLSVITLVVAMLLLRVHL